MTSSLLSKLDSFLPKMAVANETLAQSMAQDPERNVQVDYVSYVSDEEKPYIEMEIAMVPDATTMASLPEELYDASRPRVIVDANSEAEVEGEDELSVASSSSSASPTASSSSSSASGALSSIAMAASAVPKDAKRAQRAPLIEEIDES